MAIKSNRDQLQNNGNPFKDGWLGKFAFNSKGYTIPIDLVIELDRSMISFGRLIPPVFRDKMISKAENLGSIAITKAEGMNKIRAEEIRQIRLVIDANPNAVFIPSKVRSLQERKRERDKLEHFNIFSTLRWAAMDGNISAGNISIPLLKEIHERLSLGLDNFVDTFPGDMPLYNPGQIRTQQVLGTGGCEVAPFQSIEDELSRLIAVYKKDRSLETLGFFSAALYSIHPFLNGNKRLCRVLEHALLRETGINKGRLYNHMACHQMDGEYYIRLHKAIANSLSTKNLNYSCDFLIESLFFSQMAAIISITENKRFEFIKSSEIDSDKIKLFALLVKKKTMQQKDMTGLGISERSVFGYLKYGVEKGTLVKRDSKLAGRGVLYSLNMETSEESFLRDMIRSAYQYVRYFPDRLTESVYAHDENPRAAALLKKTFKPAAAVGPGLH